MIRQRVSVIAVLCALLLTAAPGAQRALPPDAVAALDALLQGELQAKVPGLSVAVAFDNRIVYSKGAGMADLQHQVPVKTTTVFRTASVAKPLTATAAMTLVKAGKLDLEAPITRYCAAWPAKHPPITVRQLLSHQAGIRHYARRGESTGTTPFFSIDDSLASFKNDPLLHEPGSKYFYTTHGYSVVGCVIEGAAGTSYEEYIRDAVFQPAGMTRSRLDRHYDIVPDRASGYQVLTEEVFKSLPPAAQRFAKVGAPYNADLHDTSMKMPGGGLLSTAEDLVRFGIALNTGVLLPKDLVETMWTDQKTTNGEPTGYGLGWGVTPMQDGVRRLTHSGNQAGASTALQVIPEVGVTIAVMTNLEDRNLAPLSRAIINVLREHMTKKEQ